RRIRLHHRHRKLCNEGTHRQQNDCRKQEMIMVEEDKQNGLSIDDSLTIEFDRGEECNPQHGVYCNYEQHSESREGTTNGWEGLTHLMRFCCALMHSF